MIRLGRADTRDHLKAHEKGVEGLSAAQELGMLGPGL